VQGVFNGQDILKFQELVRRVPVSEDVVRYAVRLAASSRPRQENAPDFVKNWINWGAGTRAGQALILGAKARALWNGRAHATGDDIRALAAPVLRHRILLNYRAEADGVSVDQIIQKLIEALPKTV
jgi:MoxR-like ATPase